MRLYHEDVEDYMSQFFDQHTIPGGRMLCPALLQISARDKTDEPFRVDHLIRARINRLPGDLKIQLVYHSFYHRSCDYCRDDHVLIALEHRPRRQVLFHEGYGMFSEINDFLAHDNEVWHHDIRTGLLESIRIQFSPDGEDATLIYLKFNGEGGHRYIWGKAFGPARENYLRKVGLWQNQYAIHNLVFRIDTCM